jgi:hypothetical protein
MKCERAPYLSNHNLISAHGQTEDVMRAIGLSIKLIAGLLIARSVILTLFVLAPLAKAVPTGLNSGSNIQTIEN